MEVLIWALDSPSPRAKGSFRNVTIQGFACLPKRETSGT